MAKVAILLLADTDTHEGLGRAVNALETVKELQEAGDEVQLIFDGAGTKWIGALSNPDHKAHKLFLMIKDKITGACSFCAGAFGATEGVKAADVPLLAQYEGHPSIRKLIATKFTILTF